jgi:hypothetical protein
MTPSAQPAPLVFSAAFGLAMVLPVAVDAHGPARALGFLAVGAVILGIQFRVAATLAVLLTVTAMVLSEAPPVLAALAGLAAAAYLVLRHAAGMPGLVTATPPTVVSAMTFGVAGLAATSFSVRLPWLPLAAPVVVFAIYALTTRPFWSKLSRADRSE